MPVLTDSYLRSLKPPAKGRIYVSDLRSRRLEFMLTAAGQASWNHRFRDPKSGRTSRDKLGDYPGVSLSQARQLNDAKAAMVAAGKNPVHVKRRTRVEAPRRKFDFLAERYMTEHAERHKSSAPADRRNLDLHILPVWGSRDYDELTRADLVELIEGLIADGKQTQANRVHALCSKIGSFAVDAGLLNGNPFGRLPKRGVEQVGRRVLKSDDEIRLFWHGIVYPPVSRQVGLALRLAFLTGVRASEAAGPHHSHEAVHGLEQVHARPSPCLSVVRPLPRCCLCPCRFWALSNGVQ